MLPSSSVTSDKRYGRLGAMAVVGYPKFSLPDYAILAVFHLVGPNVSGAAGFSRI